MVDVLEERGFGEADLKWGEPTDCRFPLFDFLKPLPLHWMCILYLIMCLCMTIYSRNLDKLIINDLIF